MPAEPKAGAYAAAPNAVAEAFCSGDGVPTELRRWWPAWSFISGLLLGCAQLAHLLLMLGELPCQQVVLCQEGHGACTGTRVQWVYLEGWRKWLGSKGMVETPRSAQAQGLRAGKIKETPPACQHEPSGLQGCMQQCSLQSSWHRISP